MNGAIAVPSVNIKRVPNNTRKIMIGANHHFLRTFRKSKNSNRIDSFDIAFSSNINLTEYNHLKDVKNTQYKING